MRYQVKLHDDSGNLLHVIRGAEISTLSMTVAENEIGELVITMPPHFIDWHLLNAPDRILTVERDVGAGFQVECGPGAERGFLLRDAERATDTKHLDTLVLYAYDGNHLLKRRTVAYDAESAQAKKTDEADDMCLLVVRENLGADATDTARAYSRLTVEAGGGNGPSITKSFARANVLSTLQSITDESWEMGTYLVFDTVYLHPGRYEFRVYLGQRGVDMGLNAINKRIVKPWPCTLRLARVDEENYIYAGGAGKEGARGIQTATNEEWTGASIWNRCEGWANAGSEDDAAAVLSAARAHLYHKRPRLIMEGELPDVDGQRYGIDYHWGDIVVARYQEVTMDCHITAVNIEYVAGRETVTVGVRSEP